MTPENTEALQKQLAAQRDELIAQANITRKIGEELGKTRDLIAQINGKALVDHCIIGALCISHPKPEALIDVFKQLWQIARGHLGKENVSDIARSAAQERIDQIGAGLSVKIF